MSDVTHENIKSSIGSLLLLWAAIERSAREAIVGAQGALPKSAYGIAATLSVWKDTVPDPQNGATLNKLLAKILCEKLQDSRHIRNGICHGLTGISGAYENNSAKLTWNLNGMENSIGWDELQELLGWLSKVPTAISMISRPLSRNISDRILDNLENREWWLTEFALKLPRV